MTEVALRPDATVWSRSPTYRLLRLAQQTDEELADGATFPPGSVHLPHWVENERLKHFVAEQLETVRTKREFARLEWQKLRERNEALGYWVAMELMRTHESHYLQLVGPCSRDAMLY